MADERDKVDPEKLRKDLLRLASLIQRLDKEGRLLEGAPRLLKLMGDLRSQIFDYEVRSTGRLLPKSEVPPEVLEAERIVQDAIQRQTEAEEEWDGTWASEDEEDEDS